MSSGIIVPQITAADVQQIRVDVGSIIRGRESLVKVYTLEEITQDEFYGIPATVSGKVTEVSGVIGRIIEDDLLLRLGGKVKAGDVKLTFYRDDLVQKIDVEKFLKSETKVEIPADTGNFYIVDVQRTTGIVIKNRVVFGMLESHPHPSGIF